MALDTTWSTVFGILSLREQTNKGSGLRDRYRHFIMTQYENEADDAVTEMMDMIVYQKG